MSLSKTMLIIKTWTLGWSDKLAIRFSSLHHLVSESVVQTMCAFHVLALLSASAATVLFGIALCVHSLRSNIGYLAVLVVFACGQGERVFVLVLLVPGCRLSNVDFWKASLLLQQSSRLHSLHGIETKSIVSSSNLKHKMIMEREDVFRPLILSSV